METRPWPFPSPRVFISRIFSDFFVWVRDESFHDHVLLKFAFVFDLVRTQTQCLFRERDVVVARSVDDRCELGGRESVSPQQLANR